MSHDDDDDDDRTLNEILYPKGRKRITHTCSECGFSSDDYHLVEKHSCDVTENGGYCEDYPCCGHEAGDCNGLKYGSDESIKDFWGRIYDSGMSDAEIGELQDRMDHGY